MRTEAYQKPDGEWVTLVTVSRRNLLSLLAKLDGAPADSHCTIVGPDFYPATILAAEPDDVHYRHVSRLGYGAGDMHPETEDEVTRTAQLDYSGERKFEEDGS